MPKHPYTSPDWTRAIFRCLLLLLLSAAVSACAVPNYSGAVKQFAAATADAQTALTSLNETATREYEAFLKSRILATSGSNLERVDRECRTAGTRCRLEILSSDPEASGQRFPPEHPAGIR